MTVDDLQLPQQPLLLRFSPLAELAGLVPALGPLVSSATAATQALYEKRVRTFLERFDAAGGLITPELLAQDNGLHMVDVTLRAVVRTHREAKIDLLARLLAGAVRKEIDDEAVDEHEEYLRIIDDLRPRELELLVILRGLETAYVPDPEWVGNKFAQVMGIWPEFQAEARQKLGIEEDELVGILARLNRTGLYRTLTGMALGYGGDQGATTVLFDRFIAAIDRGAAHS